MSDSVYYAKGVSEVSRLPFKTIAIFNQTRIQIIYFDIAKYYRAIVYGACPRQLMVRDILRFAIQLPRAALTAG